MISKEVFRDLLGQKAKELSNEDIDLVRDQIYSLAHLLLQWDKQHPEVSSEKIPMKGCETVEFSKRGL